MTPVTKWGTTVEFVGEKDGVCSFNANPRDRCNTIRRNLSLNGFSFVSVIHTALADADGARPFHISSEDQTGLSSLGPIRTGKETISVPCLPLEASVKDRRIDSVRLIAFQAIATFFIRLPYNMPSCGVEPGRIS